MPMLKFKPCLRACPLLLLSLLSACSTPTVVRTAPHAQPAAAKSHALGEPAASEAVIVINYNAGPGTHAGIFAGPRLNDPAGSYVGTRSMDKSWPGPSLADYVEYQKEDGDKILIYRFRLSPADFAALDARMAAAGPTPPLFCAVAVQNLIAGLGPFKAIPSVGWATPAGLAELLDQLVDSRIAAGKCILADNRPCAGPSAGL